MENKNKLRQLEEFVRANFSGNIFEEILKIMLLCDEYNQKSLISLNMQELNDLVGKCNIKYCGVFEESRFILQEGLVKQIISNIDIKISDYSSDFLDIYFESLISKLDKSDKGQFFTPRNVVELCVRIARPGEGDKVFDPSCGPGGFLLHSSKYNGAIRGSDLFGSDIDPRMIKLARINSIRKGLDINLTLNNTISNPIYENKFDIVLANPPFAGEIIEREVLEKYSITSKNKEDRDVLFIESIYKSLKDDGKMIIILPYAVFGSSYKKYVRQWIIENLDIIGIVSLDRNTFMPFTHQKANILIAKKTKARKGNHKIFMSISGESGKDSKGKWIMRSSRESGIDLWLDVRHDLVEVISGFESFINEEGIRW